MRTRVAETSIRAFHGHAGISVGQRERILALIETGRGNWSIGEIAAALSMEKSTVSARVRELLDDGALVERAKRKDRESGITVRPVGLPAVQADLFGGVQ
jgi:DNA-binding MarR family transcriptional regulator